MKFKLWWHHTFDEFKKWLKKTFTGIYGIDNLYFVLFGATMLLVIINVFARFWGIWLLEAALLVFMVFRILSHNIAARKRENNAFFGLFGRTKNFFILQKNKIRDRKTHVYRKCPGCHSVIRLPKRKGIHPVVCPKCSNMFNVKNK